MIKKILSTLLIAGAMSSLAIPVFAYTPAQPKAGFVEDYTLYNTAEYNGNSGISLFSVTRGNPNVKLLNSGVSRYSNPNTGNYYAKGATTVINTITGEYVYHTTTVRLMKGKKTILVEGSAYGKGEVWATSGETPTKGTPKVYWKE